MLEKPKGDRAIRREKIEYDRVIRKKNSLFPIMFKGSL